MGLPTIVLGVLAAPLGLKEAIGFMLLPSLCANHLAGAGGRRAPRSAPAIFWAFFLLADLWDRGHRCSGSSRAKPRTQLLLGVLGLVLCASIRA